MSTTVLEVKNLTTGYDHQTVLQNLSFSVSAGEMVGIVGANGSGKSTLLKALRGFLPIYEGEIKLCDSLIQTLSARKFSQLAAYLQQRVDILPGYTVHEIVTAGRYPHLHWWQREGLRDSAIVDACMSFTGIREFATAHMETLSGGQQQRVLLAKVLAQQSLLLYLDEPATGLDVFYQEEIFRLCHTLCKNGKTIIVVAHELPLAARFCSRLLLLGKGHLVAQGPADEVLTEVNLTEAYGVPIHVSVNALTGHREIFSSEVSDNPAVKPLLRILMNQMGGADHE